MTESLNDCADSHSESLSERLEHGIRISNPGFFLLGGQKANLKDGLHYVAPCWNGHLAMMAPLPRTITKMYLQENVRGSDC